jgi:hypothetical protein
VVSISETGAVLLFFTRHVLCWSICIVSMERLGYTPIWKKCYADFCDDIYSDVSLFALNQMALAHLIIGVHLFVRELLLLLLPSSNYWSNCTTFEVHIMTRCVCTIACSFMLLPSCWSIVFDFSFICYLVQQGIFCCCEQYYIFWNFYVVVKIWHVYSGFWRFVVRLWLLAVLPAILQSCLGRVWVKRVLEW